MGTIAAVALPTYMKPGPKTRRGAQWQPFLVRGAVDLPSDVCAGQPSALGLAVLLSNW